MKNKDCSNCKYHCSQSIAEPDRRRIFESFWGLQNFERQRDFICQTVQSNNPKRVIKQVVKKFNVSFLLWSEDCQGMQAVLYQHSWNW